MNKNGKTIQIFLPNGNPKGIKKAEIKTDKIEIIQSSKKDFLENKNLFDFTGIYILVNSLQNEKPEVYIGKGRVKERLNNHKDSKEFWNLIFGVRLKTDEGFNDAHMSYLEHHFIKLAKTTQRCIMFDNKQMPACPKIEESTLCELNDYIDTALVLTSTLGLKIFEPIVEYKKSTKETFELKTTFGAFGCGEYTEEGFVVFKGAKLRKTFVDSAKNSSEAKYSNKMKEQELFEQVPENIDLFILKQDHLFNSPSTAAGVIMGRSANGWTEWKNKDGKTLDDLYRKKDRS